MMYVLLLTAVDCGTLTDPANGQVNHTAGTTFEQTATYSCDTGYNLMGNNTRTCEATGEWSWSEPTCERMFVLFLYSYSGFFLIGETFRKRLTEVFRINFCDLEFHGPDTQVNIMNDDR